MAKLPKAAQGTFDELLAGVEPDLAAIARRLRAIIRAVDANAVETVRLGDNAATYGVGPKKMTDGYAYIMPMRGYVNLGFYQGALLSDPKRLLEGTGKGLRHVKIRSLSEANRAPVRGLVAAALARRRSGTTNAITKLVARYHDESAPGGRPHRLEVVAHPLPGKIRKKEPS
jgi:hypothetical protein